MYNNNNNNNINYPYNIDSNSNLNFEDNQNTLYKNFLGPFNKNSVKELQSMYLEDSTNQNNINNNNIYQQNLQNIQNMQNYINSQEEEIENPLSKFFDGDHLNYFAGMRFKELEGNSKEYTNKNLKKISKEKSSKIEKNLSKKNLIKSHKDILRENIIIKIKENPCFNKGYYNKDLNFTGSGNYTNCYDYIQKFIFKHKEESEKLKIKLNENKNKYKIKEEKYLNNTNIKEKLSKFSNKISQKNFTEDFIYLDNQFEHFKFLFYVERNDEEGINYVFEEQMKFELLKRKIKDICEKQYSTILVDYMKFSLT